MQATDNFLEGLIHFEPIFGNYRISSSKMRVLTHTELSS